MPAPKRAAVKRALLLAVGCLIAVGGLAPARAATSPVVGTVEVANPQPTLPREAYRSSASTNGLVGYVVSLTGADNKAYTLRATGLPGIDFDVYFYAHLNTGGECQLVVTKDDLGYEQGKICQETGKVAAWAVIVMTAGAHGTFELSWS